MQAAQAQLTQAVLAIGTGIGTLKKALSSTSVASLGLSWERQTTYRGGSGRARSLSLRAGKELITALDTSITKLRDVQALEAVLEQLDPPTQALSAPAAHTAHAAGAAAGNLLPSLLPAPAACLSGADLRSQLKDRCDQAQVLTFALERVLPYLEDAVEEQGGCRAYWVLGKGRFTADNKVPYERRILFQGDHQANAQIVSS